MNDPALRQSLSAELITNTPINREIFSLKFAWTGPVPRAGQFFMVRPKRSGLLLGRPISLAFWNSNIVEFLIARRGRGTEELAGLRPGEEAELTGPLGNAWTDFLDKKICGKAPRGGKPAIALIGGGVGAAPLEALALELPGASFDFYAGFRTGFKNEEERRGLLGPFMFGGNLLIATENGAEGKKGRITDFLDPAKYATVCACGPEPMLRAAAKRCKEAGTPCFVSMERRMACGVGACLGCTVETGAGNKRCCADGPIFPAEEVFFDE